MPVSIELQGHLKSRPIRIGKVRAPRPAAVLTISELSARSGAAPSALRFYESLGLISASRTAGNQRRYPRHMLRRVAFIRAGRQLGLELREIKAALGRLPADRAPTRAQWQRAARAWQASIDARISELQRMSDTLGGCIGCGCLSLRRCALYNPQDAAARHGAGARWLLGDPSPAEGD
jgi:MerR family transcriptional regulator, redox-sensitive transcriptional activator SoxR